MELQEQVHTIEPFYNVDSNILILGSFPSVKSRETGFYYGHPQNRFWKVLAEIYQSEEPVTIEDRKKFLRQHQIAVWDVVGTCEISGSSDSSIRNVIPNPIADILKETKIERIFVNGKKAEQLYKRYVCSVVGQEAICLPSTSPANAAWSMEKLIAAWKVIL